MLCVFAFGCACVYVCMCVPVCVFVCVHLNDIHSTCNFIISCTLDCRYQRMELKGAGGRDH